jgi:hypothetical protein
VIHLLLWNWLENILRCLCVMDQRVALRTMYKLKAHDSRLIEHILFGHFNLRWSNRHGQDLGPRTINLSGDLPYHHLDAGNQATEDKSQHSPNHLRRGHNLHEACVLRSLSWLLTLRIDIDSVWWYSRVLCLTYAANDRLRREESELFT